MSIKLESNQLPAILYFGKKWDAPILEDATPIVTPIGEECGYCKEPIAERDQGLLRPFLTQKDATMKPVHRECELRMVLGGINHLKGTCSCHGGTEPPDPEDLSFREAGKLVYKWCLEHGGVK